MLTPKMPVTVTVTDAHGNERRITAGLNQRGEIWLLDATQHPCLAFIVGKYQQSGIDELTDAASLALDHMYSAAYGDLAALKLTAEDYGRSVGRAWPSQWRCNAQHCSDISECASSMGPPTRMAVDGVTGLARHSVFLDGDSLATARELGSGNLSAGIRAALRLIRAKEWPTLAA